MRPKDRTRYVLTLFVRCRFWNPAQTFSDVHTNQLHLHVSGFSSTRRQRRNATKASSNPSTMGASGRAMRRAEVWTGGQANGTEGRMGRGTSGRPQSYTGRREDGRADGHADRQAGGLADRRPCMYPTFCESSRRWGVQLLPIRKHADR